MVIELFKDSIAVKFNSQTTLISCSSEYSTKLNKEDNYTELEVIENITDKSLLFIRTNNLCIINHK